MPLTVGKAFNETLPKARRADRISHFILRLAFCQTPEQTKWFINQEVELFRFRFGLETRANIMSLVKSNNFDLIKVEADEKKKYSNELMNGSGIRADKFEMTEFWKVQFTQALELVRRRKGFLANGFIYITFNDLAAVVTTKFRLIMSKAMAVSCFFALHNLYIIF